MLFLTPNQQCQLKALKAQPVYFTTLLLLIVEQLCSTFLFFYGTGHMFMLLVDSSCGKISSL